MRKEFGKGEQRRPVGSIEPPKIADQLLFRPVHQDKCYLLLPDCMPNTTIRRDRQTVPGCRFLSAILVRLAIGAGKAQQFIHCPLAKLLLLMNEGKRTLDRWIQFKRHQ